MSNFVDLTSSGCSTHRDVVYSEFTDQLPRNPEGYCETGLPRQCGHPQLPTNKPGSLRRLQQLLKKLERTNTYNQYDAIIQEQLEEGIVELAPATPTGCECYIPHKAVIRENAETTTVKIVYDTSAREGPNQPSLNDCLHPGPPLQNLRSRFYPVILIGDLQKAFLQIRIEEEERDALRFHWKPHEQYKIKTNRFKRALFGLTSSPFLLGGVIRQYLEAWEQRGPELVTQIRKSLYVDYLLSGAPSVQEAKQLKKGSTEIFGDANFTLHKWNSNEPSLERDEDSGNNEDRSYAKQELGTQPTKTKLLGLPWDKAADLLSVCFLEQQTETTTESHLLHLDKIYDPLGLVSPMKICGKFIF